jgi:hypothetical protein
VSGIKQAFGIVGNINALVGMPVPGQSVGQVMTLLEKFGHFFEPDITLI